MAIVSGDIDFHGSGGTGETDPNAWLGGVRSTTQVTDNSDNNLFADVSGAEASAGSTKFRCIYYENAHGSLTLQAAFLWIETNTTSADDTIRIGLDLVGLNGTADTIADEDTAPSPAVTFSTAANKGAGLSLGNVPTLQHYAFWIERVVDAASSALAANSFVLEIEGDTNA